MLNLKPFIRVFRLRSNVQHILLAGSTVALAFLLSAALRLFIPVENPLLIFFGAVLTSAWIGGIKSGLLATLLAVLLADYFFLNPISNLLIMDTDTAVQMLIFCAEGIFVSLFSYGMHVAYQRAVEEITLHEQTEQSLRESEERFRLLVESVQDYAIFMLDPNGIITLWNKGAERIKGYSAQEIIGKPLSILYTNDEYASNRWAKLMKIAIEKGSAEDEGWRVRKDGTKFWANVLLTSLWVKGELRGFAKVTRDMTERRRNEQVLESLNLERLARQEAERANELKTHFLAVISHELRTPLTSIKGFTSTLLANDIIWKPEEQQQFLAIVDSEADKLRELIEQLLNMSQIQAGILRMDIASRSITLALDVAKEQLSILLRNRTFTVSLPDDLPNVCMDEYRIAQVITNIVGNAVKYTPPETPIFLTAFQNDSMVQVEIHDEGPGIPVEQREKVFELFNQLGRNIQASEGVGLGLAICKGLITAHGGTIWVKDDPRQGATIAFTLPLAKEEVKV